MGRGLCEAASRTIFTGGNCASTCSAQVADLVYEEGCCAGTLVEAQARWLSDVTGNQCLGARFRVDWGGGRIEEFRAASSCRSSRSMVDAVCLAGQCGIGDSIWPAACCNTSAAACANGGSQAEAGACWCVCPDGWTGAKCTGRVPHVRLGLLLVGTTLRAWMLGAAAGFRALIMAQVNPAAVEYDGAPLPAGDVGGRRGTSEPNSVSSEKASVVGLQVQMRLIGRSDNDALQLLELISQLVSNKVSFVKPQIQVDIQYPLAGLFG